MHRPLVASGCVRGCDWPSGLCQGGAPAAAIQHLREAIFVGLPPQYVSANRVFLAVALAEAGEQVSAHAELAEVCPASLHQCM